MTTDINRIKSDVKAYILEEFLPGENPDALTDETELITHGVLDSLSTMQLVTFIEEQYSVKVAAHEMNADNLNTLSDIASLIASKN